MSVKAPLRTCFVPIVTAIMMASCSREPEYTDVQRACIAQHYTKYESKDFNQCVDVCRACMSGTMTTCTTSCKLNGAN
jgi:hypothetical protein